LTKIAYSFKILYIFATTVVLISSTISGSSFSALSANSKESCENSTVTNISASRSDQNFPAAAVLDANPQTIWSTYGKGAWIEMDLGDAKSICSVDIKWYKGDQRWNNFVISTSNDGSSYHKVFDSKSSGHTSSFERYNLQDISARYIKITLNGNTQNNYASIADILVKTSKDSNKMPDKVSTSALSEECAKAKISKATASGHHKNYIPANAIDNNDKTRWVNEKKNSWIKLYLGKTQTICGIDVQWFKGDTRVYSFTVSVSRDNKKFTDVAKLKSSGNTKDIESYDLKDVKARIVRVKVTGNTENNFASIVEIGIKSKTTSDPPSPPPPSPGPGTDGIKQVYPTAEGGENWFFNPDNPDDGQFDPNGADISKNADGSWHVDPGTTRMLAFTKSAGLLSNDARGNLPTYDYSELAQIGHWYKPTDWKNTEMTGYFKVTSTKAGDGISFVTRSVRHNEAVADGCGGSSYHNNIRFEGTSQYKKEQWHVNYDNLPPTKNGIGSIMNKWVGFKGVVYNLPNGNVKLESYVDKNNNNEWEKVHELTDSGNWGDDMTHCNADKNGAQITWGSPMIIFKSTGVTYDFKKLSMREIVPPS
jgi:hypothetical protein